MKNRRKCGKTFSRKFNGNVHYKNVHLKPKEKNVKCKLCKERFFTEIHMQRHMKRVHNLSVKSFKKAYKLPKTEIKKETSDEIED